MSAEGGARNPAWTPGRDAELLRLVDEGHTYAEIGRRMGITKNAALGRAKRIGVEDRRETPYNPVYRPLTVFPPAGCCQWITNDRAPFTFCGHTVSDDPRHEERLWCAAHRERVYQKEPSRDKVGA